jgi:excisionase family DNA binding protein
MSLFDERSLRALVSDEIRRVLCEEKSNAPLSIYLPVAEAAAVAAVTPDTIRVWIGQGRLNRYAAGRELRVKRSELEDFLRIGPTRSRLSPEREAEEFLSRRTIRKRLRGVG